MPAPLVFAALVFAILARPVIAAPEDHESWLPITSRDLRADARLQQGVTVLGPRKFVGEVLEVLSERTGVRITPDDASGAADPRLIVWIKDQPAWKAMSALASLFSYRNAGWYWERKGDVSTGVYRLVQTRSAQRLAKRLVDHAQAEFERVTADLITATRRSSQEWTQRLASPEPVGVEERTGWGVQLFASCLSPEMQREVLRGEQRVTVPVDSLPPFGRRLVEDTYQHMRPYRAHANGTIEALPMPAHVEFMASLSLPEPTRSLYIQMGHMGGYSYAGGMPLKRAFRDYLRDLWIGEDDAAGDDERERLLVASGKISEDTQRLDHLERVCMELAELTDLPILVRSPSLRSTTTNESPAGRLLGEYLSTLPGRYAASHKWHEGFLLISYAGWFHMPDEVHRPPYSVIRRLRSACENNNGLITAEAVLDACRSLTADQLRALEPYMAGFAQLAEVQSVLCFVDKRSGLRQRLLREGQINFTGPVLRTLIPPIHQGAVQGGGGPPPHADKVVRMAISLRQLTFEGTRSLEVHAYLYDASGNLLSGPGATFRPGRP